MKLKFLLLTAVVLLLQSCSILNIKKDYGGNSKTLVFTQNKKWLINNVHTDLLTTDRIKLDEKLFSTFNNLSKGNAFKINEARKENLLTSKISYSPSEYELATLKENTDFDFLVNAYTVKVKDQISEIELTQPFDFMKNEAFAVVEVYDIKTLKLIYTLKASSLVTMEGERYDLANNGLDNMRNPKEKSGPFFTSSASQISRKCFKKILKDISKNAIK